MWAQRLAFGVENAWTPLVGTAAKLDTRFSVGAERIGWISTVGITRFPQVGPKVAEADSHQAL
jgi:hypothetical protein